MHPIVGKLGLMPADRIVVPKSGLRVVQHHAVYLGQNQKGQDLLAENKIGFGVRLITADEFFKDVIEVTRIEKFTGDNYERKIVVRNALHRLGQPYNLINYNCQHFANEVIEGKKESEQVNNFFKGVKAVGAFIVFAAIIYEISKD